MKSKINYILGLLLIVMMFSCSKVIIYETTAEEDALYGKLYIPKAERGVVQQAVSPSGEPIDLDFNVYLGGPKDAGQDIQITAAADASLLDSFNRANGTNYELLPASNYQLTGSNLLITAGQRMSNKLQVQIKPDANLQLFKSYLLPITIQSQSSGIATNQKFQTIYYVIQVSYPRGEVPRDKVLSLGANWGLFIGPGSRGSLLLKKNNHDIMSYVPDQAGVFSDPPKVVGVFWDASESWYLIDDQSIVFRNHPYWAGLFSFRINADYTMAQANPFWLGDFWNKWTLVPFKNYLLTVDANGIMNRQPVLSNVSAAKTEVATGFKGYKQLMAFKDELLALESNGKLWAYSMSELAVPSNRRLIGEGFDMYQKIMVLKGDLVGLDAAGDIYRYKDFRTDGFYPLK
ncbi:MULTISPECIES: DUF1735 domain-containing protein [Sphingobacterium]|uniref:DUF1735 domain-containing protein n=1 Tax=Sphingobacterium tenebrionis TaxID=3111775 RepID=A0ABU8I3A5_9SPHI|nr:DUF1735 domain-containing protein [Sphingobacterium sp. CZ-2]QBR11758.1 DUF1735 domain-containing protein [Sphingobacterium sp. CZ-2]